MKELEEKLQTLRGWVGTGQVKTDLGRMDDDLLTLIGQMEVIIRKETLQSKGKTKEEVRQIMNDFTPKVYEFLLKPPFHMGHTQHAIACEKFADIRNQFVEEYAQSHANKDGATPFQCCPICNGSGQIYEPLSTGSYKTCSTCEGKGIIPMHINKDGGVTKEDFVTELDKHFKNRPDLNKEFDRIDSLIASIRMCTRPIQEHNDPKSINDCFEELEYYSKLLRSRTTLPPKPQI